MQNQEKIIEAIAAYLEKNTEHIWHSQGERMAFSEQCEYPVFSEKSFLQARAAEILTAIAPHLEAGVGFHDPSEYPTRVEGEDFSVDVFILDETGVHGIAFWNFDDEVWRFHTDTLVDYNEPNAETKWKWYYPPFGLDQVFKSQ